MASALASSVIVAVASFATTPYLLDQLGAARYGAYRAALGWFGILGLLEFGVGGALQALAAQALSSDNPSNLAATVRAGFRAYCFMAVLMIMVALGLAVALPWLIRIPASLNDELYVGSGFYILTLAFLPLGSFRSLIEAEQRGYVINLLLAAQALTAAFLAVILAGLGWDLPGQFAALMVGGFVFHLGLAWDGLRRHPKFLDYRAVRTGSMERLWSLSWPTFLFNLSGRLGLASDELVVAGMLGPAAVTSFFVTQRVISVVGSQMTAVGAATWAGLVDLHFRGEHLLFQRRLAQVTRLTAVLGAALLVPVAVRNHDIIVLWVGPDRYAGELVTYLAMTNTWLLGIIGLWLWPLSGAGLVRRTLPATVTCAALNLVGSIGATALVGLPGPLIGTALSLLGMNWWWALLLLRRHLGVASGPLLSAAAGPAFLALAYGGLLTVSVRWDPSFLADLSRWAHVLALAAWLGGASIGYLVLAFMLVVPATDRNEWVGRIRARRSGSTLAATGGGLGR